MLGLDFFLVNAFTYPASDRPSGNQAAVVVLPDGTSRPDQWFLDTAQDFGFSETAFVWPIHITDSALRYGLRWWTPEMVR